MEDGESLRISQRQLTTFYPDTCSVRNSAFCEALKSIGVFLLKGDIWMKIGMKTMVTRTITLLRLVRKSENQSQRRDNE